MLKLTDEDFYRRLRTVNQRLGLIFGLAVGLGFSAAMWVPDAWKMQQAQVGGAWLSLISGLVLCLPLALLAGWLVGRSASGLAGALGWAVAAAAMTWIAGHIPYEPQSWWVAFLDPAYQGLQAYPYGISAVARSLISIIVSVVIALIAGGMQPQVIDALRSSVGFGRVSSLLICTVLFFGAGWVGNLTMYQPLREPMIAVDDLFRTAENYQGQQLSASQRRELRLNTLRPVEDLLGQHRRLYLGNYDPESLETARVNLTLGEEWVSCIALAGTPLHCQKSNDLYGSPFNCVWQNHFADREGCGLRISPAAQSDLKTASRLHGVRVASQIGQYSLVEVYTANEHEAYLCRVLETSPRMLETCRAFTSEDFARASASQAPMWLAPEPEAAPGRDMDWLANRPHYTLAVTLDPAQQRFNGELTLVFTNTHTVQLDHLLLRLLPNSGMSYGNGALRVADGLAVNGQQVQPANPGGDLSQLSVPLEGGLAAGQNVQVSLSFSGTIPQDFGGEAAPYAYGIYNLSDNVLTLASWYPILAVFEDGAWRADAVLPIGDSVYSEIAAYDVTITAPAAWQVAATGVQQGQAPAGEGWIEYRYQAGYARDFFITASPNFQLLSSQAGNVTVNAYYLPGSEDGAAKALEVGTQAVQIFSRLFGTYPYTELDIVQAPMRNALGVEYPGIVLIGADGYAEPDDPAFTVTVAHEAAHQWWYNVVGNDVFLEPWLDEGLTTFSSAVYYEEAAGPQAYAEVRAYWQARVDKIANEGRDAPLSWSLDEFMQQDPEAYAPVAYSKGALFFDELRKRVGDEAFFAALRSYYQDQLYQIATEQDLRDAFVQYAGADIESFFDEWLK
ncbi:MAG: M1 family metallopeptidase [Anaerolineales bacterium]|jgi:hypothetical protein|nr:M1 family metallopeptidase [Anaerolineales bacterium]